MAARRAYRARPRRPTVAGDASERSWLPSARCSPRARSTRRRSSRSPSGPACRAPPSISTSARGSSSIDSVCDIMGANPALVELRRATSACPDVCGGPRRRCSPTAVALLGRRGRPMAELYGVVAVDPGAQSVRRPAATGPSHASSARLIGEPGPERGSAAGMTKARALALLLVLTSFGTYRELREAGLVRSAGDGVPAGERRAGAAVLEASPRLARRRTRSGWRPWCGSGDGSAASASAGRLRTSRSCGSSASSVAAGWSRTSSRTRWRRATCCRGRRRRSSRSTAPGAFAGRAGALVGGALLHRSRADPDARARRALPRLAAAVGPRRGRGRGAAVAAVAVQAGWSLAARGAARRAPSPCRWVAVPASRARVSAATLGPVARAGAARCGAIELALSARRRSPLAPAGRGRRGGRRAARARLGRVQGRRALLRRRAS